MSEYLLQFLWLHRLYDTSKALTTLDGEEIIVLHPGIWNKNAGPDFLEARLLIGNTKWVGHIEIHVKSSDWFKHGHEKDTNYASIILHVVFEHDKVVYTVNDNSFPTLEIKSYVQTSYLKKYAYLQQTNDFIACAKRIKDVSALIIKSQLDKNLHERLQEKINPVSELLHEHHHDWQEVFYLVVAQSFGLHINQESFANLAKQTPLRLLDKYKTNLFQVEALLFGQAGFLDEYFDEEYPQALQNEYAYLKKLHHLQSMPKEQWKFLRLRPANFPTLRIAQLAALLHDSVNLFSKIIDAKTIKELEQFFMTEPSSYWKEHYHFTKKVPEQTKGSGKSFAQLIIINSIVPILYRYGKMQGNEQLCAHAIRLLSNIKPENNAIVQNFRRLNIHPENAGDTQAILHLKKNYCDQKRCLDCSIGYKIMKG